MLFIDFETFKNKYNKVKSLINYMKSFLLLLTLFLSVICNPLYSNEISLEDEIKKAFKDYPFECNPEGSTPEIAACAWIELIKSDRALRQELNDQELYEEWTTARNKLCNFFQNKLYAGGTIRQITRPGCSLRVNNEVQKYCLTGDPTCG